MRPKIITSKSVARSLRYNEQKVELGKAECLLAANFLKDPDHLSVGEKLRCFERRMELNERVRTSLHITLNFDPRDNLSNDRMQRIARTYMEDIGFGRQPYLVYRHNDAGHPHCHIVTTHVRSDGSPIDLYHIGLIQSEKARQHIEKEYALVTAEMKQRERQEQQQMDGVRMVKYGEKSLARSVSDVLEHVTQGYRYTSLEELNAILRLYRVEAYRGGEGTHLYQSRGLLYRVLDEHGKYIGVPLKASFFDCRPTLDNLERNFAHHQMQREVMGEPAMQRIHNYVGYHLLGARDLDTVAQDLRYEEIRIQLQRDKEGRCEEVFYVDVREKCVLSGSVLGKGYGRDTIRDLMDRGEKLRQVEALRQTEELTHRRRLSLHL